MNERKDNQIWGIYQTNDGIFCDADGIFGDNLHDAVKRMNGKEWRWGQGWEWMTAGVEMKMMRNG